MADKSSSRYKTEVVTPSIAMQLLDGVLGVASGGAIKPTSEIKITDTKSGETRTGYGTSKEEARNDAHSKFKK